MVVATRGSDEKWPGGLERALVLSLLPPTVWVAQRRGDKNKQNISGVPTICHAEC